MTLEFVNTQLSGRRVTRGGTLVYLAAVVAGVGIGVHVGRTGSSLSLVAPIAIAALAAVATMGPRVALVVGLSAMALPYTWGPTVPKLGFGMGILIGLFLGLSHLANLRRFRPSALDLAVSAFAITPAAIAALDGGAFHITSWFAPVILFPYFGFRLLLINTHVSRAFGPAVIAIGVVVSLIGIWEGISGHNPLAKAGSIIYGPGNTYVTTWNVQQYRDGHLRALSTFGDPIAFGMFLLIPLAFALVRRGTLNIVALGIILTAEAFTFSRGPWIGTVVVLVLLVHRGHRRILLVAGTLVLAALFVGPIHRILLESTSASTQAGANTYYRLGLLSYALHHITPLGHPFIDLQTAIPNYADVTSLLAGTIIITGLVGLVELVVIVVLATSALLDARRSADRDYYAGAAALTAQFVGLLTVTLITNYQFFFWALVAYVATAHQHYARQRHDGREHSVIEALTPQGRGTVNRSTST